MLSIFFSIHMTKSCVSLLFGEYVHTWSMLVSFFFPFSFRLTWISTMNIVLSFFLSLYTSLLRPSLCNTFHMSHGCVCYSIRSNERLVRIFYVCILQVDGWDLSSVCFF